MGQHKMAGYVGVINGRVRGRGDSAQEARDDATSWHESDGGDAGAYVSAFMAGAELLEGLDIAGPSIAWELTRESIAIPSVYRGDA